MAVEISSSIYLIGMACQRGVAGPIIHHSWPTAPITLPGGNTVVIGGTKQKSKQGAKRLPCTRFERVIFALQVRRRNHLASKATIKNFARYF